MKTNHFSALSGLKRRRRPCRPSITIRTAAALPLLDFWQQKSSIILLGAVALIVIAVLVWFILRRRSDEFPEIRLEAKRKSLEKNLTLIEGRPEPAARSAFSPGIYGKIEVMINDQLLSTYLITDNPLTIGRDPAQALAIIQEAIVSKLHCSIFCRDGQVVIKDLNSTNGTYVNEEKIGERALQDNDVVYLGKKGTIKIIYHK